MSYQKPLPVITLFTPCYNCASTIKEVAECVNNQTFKNFEWIIYNDGSTDNSEAVINEIMKVYNHLNIIFLNPGVNRGKHIAWNRAVEMAKGELFICADADDTFEPDSLQFYYEKWQENREDPNCCGILGLVDTMETGELHAGKWPQDGWKSNYLDFTFKYRICGETWGVTRTTTLRQRPFIELYNGCFGESYIWQWLAIQDYHYICYNHITRHYRTESPGSLIATISKRKYKSSQILINIIMLLWQLKYTSKWYIRYSKKEYIKKIFKLPYMAYLYIKKGDSSA